MGDFFDGDFDFDGGGRDTDLIDTTSDPGIWEDFSRNWPESQDADDDFDTLGNWDDDDY